MKSSLRPSSKHVEEAGSPDEEMPVTGFYVPAPRILSPEDVISTTDRSFEFLYDLLSYFKAATQFSIRTFEQSSRIGDQAVLPRRATDTCTNAGNQCAVQLAILI
jgi:hypothetical protein